MWARQEDVRGNLSGADAEAASTNAGGFYDELVLLSTLQIGA
jgi:hypothetical protein